jgi:hypothetical protein
MAIIVAEAEVTQPCTINQSPSNLTTMFLFLNCFFCFKVELFTYAKYLTAVHTDKMGTSVPRRIGSN